jgi:hypothetical protein
MMSRTAVSSRHGPGEPVCSRVCQSPGDGWAATDLAGHAKSARDAPHPTRGQGRLRMPPLSAVEEPPRQRAGPRVARRSRHQGWRIVMQSHGHRRRPHKSRFPEGLHHIQSLDRLQQSRTIDEDVGTVKEKNAITVCQGRVPLQCGSWCQATHREPRHSPQSGGTRPSVRRQGCRPRQATWASAILPMRTGARARLAQERTGWNSIVRPRGRRVPSPPCGYSGTSRPGCRSFWMGHVPAASRRSSCGSGGSTSEGA